jgi:hypothetical protein
MDISPYLRKPLRSLQEVEETRRPRDAADGAQPAAAEHSGPSAAIEDGSAGE